MIKKAITVGNHAYTVHYPDECPICHHYSEIQVVKTDEALERNEVQVVFQCAFTSCKSFFIGYYGPRGQDQLRFLKPIKPNTTAVNIVNMPASHKMRAIANKIVQRNP